MSRRSVALLIETSNGHGRGLLDGVVAYVKESADWSVFLTEQERGAVPPNWLKNWRGDGIIARIETDDIADQLRDLCVPIVDLSATRHVKGIPWTSTDDVAIAGLGVQHFMERGFHNLAYCGDPGFAWSNLRRDRYRELTLAAERKFFEYQSTHRYDPQFDWEQEKTRLGHWLTTLPRPAAIMACYDFQAQQVLDACRQSNIAVPESVAVLGVDNDHLICELADPSLSSIVQDTHGTGYEAARLLDEMMDTQMNTAHPRHPANSSHRRDRTNQSRNASPSKPSPLTDPPLLTKPLGVVVRESTDTLAIDDHEISRALQYIRRHANSNIRVCDVLKTLNLSRRSLEHRFKKLIGRTPHEEIQRVRLNSVKRLLSETELSIAAIAERSGYEHGEYMTAVFRRVTGVTPTEYRRERLETPES
ncbi:DNA-binding transcriptional regulator [bacterium]|nr:DNA-binding transcriptional regulator [bacterium]